jgi:hypothetical protein
VAGAWTAVSKDGATGGGDSLGSSGRFARAHGSMNVSATYDSRTNDVESSVVARDDLWRAEASHSSNNMERHIAARWQQGDGASHNSMETAATAWITARDDALRVGGAVVPPRCSIRRGSERYRHWRRHIYARARPPPLRCAIRVDQAAPPPSLA